MSFKPITLAQISRLLAEVSETSRAAFDEKRLAVLAQGNRSLMLTALRDAQRENRRDLEAARVAAREKNYPSVKHHIHRLNGTAQLLGLMNWSILPNGLKTGCPMLFRRQNLSTFWTK